MPIFNAVCLMEPEIDAYHENVVLNISSNNMNILIHISDLFKLNFLIAR